MIVDVLTLSSTGCIPCYINHDLTSLCFELNRSHSSTHWWTQYTFIHELFFHFLMAKTLQGQRVSSFVWMSWNCPWATKKKKCHVPNDQRNLSKGWLLILTRLVKAPPGVRLHEKKTLLENDITRNFN